MRRVLIVPAILIALVALPPLYYAVLPEETPDLPPAGRRVALGSGAGVNVLDWGAGSPVVLVHGLPGTGYHWQAVGEGLAERGLRALAYDRVGYGRSDARADADYTADANARDLLALLERENLSDVTVVGWSFGGKTAMTAALRDPARIGRLVLVASAGLWETAPPPSRVVSVLFSRPVVEWVFAVPPITRRLQQGMGRVFFSEQPVPAWFSPQSTANFARATTRHTWREEAARFRFDGPDPAPIERPILVLHGDDDRIIPLVVAEGIHRRAPRSELVVVEGGSHAIPATHADLVAGRIAAFSGIR